ncbi:LAO/AO transport system kinase [Rhodoligotrophos appendicifer]|uniref:ArgK/MeaB family GTPase n=1 Tax=Rhodoligotrophos appendicifer TaxID=987056 RepID=UPI0011857E2E|nr:GTP-binding protein [Rhodoligotrophos appendicifer]
MNVAERRAFSRALSGIMRATVDEVLAHQTRIPAAGQAADRIGITGPPGAGKSTLIGHLIRNRLATMGPTARLAVIAIDPTSPISHGSILGDRIRMDTDQDDPRVFIRSLPSSTAQDGLSDNISDILGLIDTFGFSETILETVGVGQAEHAIRLLVDTMVLIVPPEAGDAVQAIKAGIIELPDIYVVNKADLPGAGRALAEMRWLAGQRPRGAWQPPILATSDRQPDSWAALGAAIDSHRGWLRENSDAGAIHAARLHYQVTSLVLRRIKETAGARPLPASLAQGYADCIRRLAHELK